MKAMKTSRLCLVALAALLMPSLGCMSVTKVRLGQLTTGGHIKVTEKPRLAIEKADDGLGLKLALGWVELGAATTHDPEAKHLAIGIDSSTGFDGKKDTLVTSASRIGLGPVDIGGELAFGLERITLKGLAKIDGGVPAIYADHWTGATATYKPFPAVPGNPSGNMLHADEYLILGPYSLSSGLSIIGECRPGSFECGDWQLDTGIGPILLDAGATSGECAQGFGFGGYIGITDEVGNDMAGTTSNGARGRRCATR